MRTFALFKQKKLGVFEI